MKKEYEMAVKLAGTKSLLAVLTMPIGRMAKASSYESAYNRALFHDKPRKPKRVRVGGKRLAANLYLRDKGG